MVGLVCLNPSAAPGLHRVALGVDPIGDWPPAVGEGYHTGRRSVTGADRPSSIGETVEAVDPSAALDRVEGG